MYDGEVTVRWLMASVACTGCLARPEAAAPKPYPKPCWSATESAYGAITPQGENGPWLSPEANELYYGNLANLPDDTDIQHATFESGNWQFEVVNGINSPAHDDDPFYDKTNQVLWFSSNAMRGDGQSVIVCEPQIAPLTFDMMMRTTHDELGTRGDGSMEPALGPDGAIYFTRDGTQIWRAYPSSTAPGPVPFDPPLPLAYTLAPDAIESPSLADDNATLYFSYHDPIAHVERIHYGAIDHDAIIDLGEAGMFQVEATSDYFDPFVSPGYRTLSYAKYDGTAVRLFYVTNDCPP